MTTIVSAGPALDTSDLSYSIRVPHHNGASSQRTKCFNTLKGTDQDGNDVVLKGDFCTSWWTPYSGFGILIYGGVWETNGTVKTVKAFDGGQLVYKLTSINQFISVSISDQDLSWGRTTDWVSGVDFLMGNDSITGSNHVDQLYGMAGQDVLEGRAGGDLLDGGDGADTASYARAPTAVSVDLSAAAASGGDAEGDTLVSIENVTGSRWGNDTLIGDDGANVLSGNGGDDMLRGGLGNDTLKGGPGDDSLLGGAGNDHLDGGPEADVMEGGSGDDTYVLDHPDDVIIESAAGGTDTVMTRRSFTLAGSLENLTLTGGRKAHGFGSDADNEILGNRAKNNLFGENGDDTLLGMGGKDKLWGGAGDDTLDGGSGKDKLFGEAGNDELYGGNGKDKLWGGDDDDLLYGGNGKDKLWGEAGHDELHGGAGKDKLFGGEGDDLLYGDGGKDKLIGGAGHDELHGGDGKDKLIGGEGDDLLDGGTGKDKLVGQAGNDTLVWDPRDRVMHGGEGEDTLLVSGAGDLQGPGRARSIETIDTDNGVANTLSLSAGQVVGLSGTDQLLIMADAMDTATFTGEWSFVETNLDGYHVFTAPTGDGPATLLLDPELTSNLDPLIS